MQFRPSLARRLLALALLAPAASAGQDPPEDVAADSVLTFHQAPKPLSADAVVEPWPRFLGPHDNASTKEAPLASFFSEDGPPLLWEREKGTGYASPALADGRLFLFHRLGDRETVECLAPETGRRLWVFDYPVVYRDKYGYSNGPRAGPVISEKRVYLLGVTAMLHCLDADTGNVLWKRNLEEEFEVPQNFFGAGPSPLVLGDKLILNLGGRDSTVAAFEKTTGKILWTTPDEWGASYASPVAATLRGKERILVFAGGESDSPYFGGLLCVDPGTGEIDDRFPWRADKYESVNASTPLVAGDDRIYISECYEKGGVMLEVDEDFKFKVAWKAPGFGMHWMTPVLHDGYLYGFRGRNEPDALLTCYDAATGNEQWRESEKMAWKKEIDGRNFGWGFFRGSILRAGEKFIVLGELGTLALFDLSPEGVTITSQAQLFAARSTWTLPALHRGLLYVSQNEPDVTGEGRRRLLCYDLRG